ncbi:MAG: hypothetical protein ACJ76X_06535 [Solirubrobacteraceae bacterium]
MSADYTLDYGTHRTPEDGRCAMEWVSYLAGEPHSDQPLCVSPVLRAFCIALNDGLEDGPRQRLRPFLTRTIGTAEDGLDAERAWLAIDWLIRTYTPTWLNRAGLSDAAHALVSLPGQHPGDDLAPALSALRAARAEARDAWGSGPSGWLTPTVIARATAREMAWKAAGAAAWGAARAGIDDETGDQARAAARAAAGDAAATLVRAAQSGIGRAAAREAAHRTLAPTLHVLCECSFELLDRMLPTVTVELPEPRVIAAH